MAITPLDTGELDHLDASWLAAGEVLATVLIAAVEAGLAPAAGRRDAESILDEGDQETGGPTPDPYDLLAGRDFDGRPRAAGRDIEREPLIGVIGAYGDNTVAELVAGQVMERILLTATTSGLAASLISQPIEVPAYREQLRLALGRRHPPQIVARFGYATSTAPSPRRPLSDVIIEG